MSLILDNGTGLYGTQSSYTYGNLSSYITSTLNTLSNLESVDKNNIDTIASFANNTISSCMNNASSISTLNVLYLNTSNLVATLPTLTGTQTLTNKTIDYTLNNITNIPVFPGRCEGRLTLESTVPISTTDQTAKTTIYFTPYDGCHVSLYNGTIWVDYTFSQISVALGTLTAAKNYDLFLYNNSGTVALEIGAAWTSDTTRSVGISLQNGTYVKATDSTRLYVGTFRTTTTTTTEDSFGGTSTSVGGKRFLWNYYNRIQKNINLVDNTVNWAYTTNTWRQARATAGNRIEYISGVNGIMLDATLCCNANVNANTATIARIAIGIDSTTVPSGVYGGLFSTYAGTNILPLTAYYKGMPALGYHAINWIEIGATAGLCTFEGTGDGSITGIAAYIYG